MRKIYLFLLMVLTTATAYTAKAQYAIINDTMIGFVDSGCMAPKLQVTTDAYANGQQMEISWGDGQRNTFPVNGMVGFPGYVAQEHSYTAAGAYTIKMVLLYNLQRVDSTIRNFDYMYCRFISIRPYYDLNNNCVFDSATEYYINAEANIQIDSANVPIQSLFTNYYGGFYYKIKGPVGTVYKFTINLSTPGTQLTCPGNNYILDTVSLNVNGYISKNYGISCSAAPPVNYDIALSVPRFDAALHEAGLPLYVSSTSCNPVMGTLVVNMSPKYTYQSAPIPPTTINGNTVTWDLTNISSLHPIEMWAMFHAVTPLFAGDTAHVKCYMIVPGGDTIQTNDTAVCIDTAHLPSDPNMKLAEPEGDITSGTTLRYFVEFENVGNAPAHNIHIMDTLSDNVLPNTLKIISASAYLNTAFLDDGAGHTIVKFDFPGINLLDTSHHDSCRGDVIYTIQTKPGLPSGTYITNSAGIYFDFNDVVMTNTTVNMIGYPQQVATMSNNIKTNIYPNPVTDILTINTNDQAYNSLEISNTIGQSMINQKITQSDTKVNVKNLPSGIYTITLKGDQGKKTFKFEKL